MFLQVDNLRTVRSLVTNHSLQSPVGDRTNYNSNRQQDSSQFLGNVVYYSNYMLICYILL